MRRSRSSTPTTGSTSRGPYGAHDVGTTPGIGRDYVKALRAIKAKMLILAGQKDLLNPEWEPLEAPRYIRDVRYVAIRPEAITGHASAGGLFPADVDVLNADFANFLDLVTGHGARLR
jgi:homoserine O-acetyltransferase